MNIPSFSSSRPLYDCGPLWWCATLLVLFCFPATLAAAAGSVPLPAHPPLAAQPAAQPASGPPLRRFAANLSAGEALAAMESGRLTASAYVDVLIEQIQAHPEINAFTFLDVAGARAAAASADALRAEGSLLGPLHGLPVMIKDSIDVAGMPTTAGTPALADYVPASNAPVVQALVDAGAIILGKTNVHELSTGYTTNNAFTGPTRNPYDIDRIPGGSSGGNSAGLAARFAPLSIGEDTAGSTRVPAALTGTTGFRPTTGRYSLDGVVPIASSLDTLGPMARNVRDLALADAIITGEPPELEAVDLAGLRIGVPQAIFREGLDPVVERAFDLALGRLERAGAVVVEADVPGAGELSQLAINVIAFFEAPVDIATFLAAHETGVTIFELIENIASPDVAAIFELAASGIVTEEDYLFVTGELAPMLRQLYLDYFDANGLDALVYPTVPVPAPRIGEEFVMVGGEAVSIFDLFMQRSHYTPVIGAPTVSVPLGQGPANLPAGGMDIAARPGEDRRVLAIAEAIARALPQIRPPVTAQPAPQRWRCRGCEEP